MVKNEKLIKQILKFGVVGGIAFLIDYVVLFCCKEYLGFSVFISAIYNYIASVKWVFDVDKEKDPKRNFIIFIVLSIIGLIITEIIMWMGTDLIHIHYLIVKIFATAVVMVFNFVTRKMFLE